MESPPAAGASDGTEAGKSPRLLARSLGSNAFLLCGLIAAPTLLLLALWLPQLPRQWAIHAVESHGGEVSFDETIPEWVYGLFGERVERLEPVVGIDLDGKGIDDSLMPQLRLLSSAEVVWLNSARITDAGAAELLEFRDITSLDLGDSLVTEAMLVPLLRRQPNLHTVWLQGTAAGDGALEALAGKAWLNDVTLARTRVTDKGLAHLATLPALDELDLSETSVGDAGLAHLASCPMLSTLNLSKTRVTDAGLEHLARMPALTSLSLSETPIDGSGLKFLAAKRLTEVNLDQTGVGDEGLEHVAAIRSLRAISLAGTRVTDAGLAKLAGAQQLNHICLHDTPTTREGISQLRQALPDCSVERSSGHGEELR